MEESFINTKIAEIESRLDLIEQNLQTILNWKPLAQAKFQAIQDQIANINELPTNHEDRITAIELKTPTIDTNTTRIQALENEVFP